MNTAIIVAAGSGKRFGGQTAKQFLEILGKPLVIHTIQRFEICPEIDEIILVLPATENARFLEIAGKYGFKKISEIVDGGETRAESVRKGLRAVRAATAEIVAVHDGARPLVSVAEISETVEKAKEAGAACLVSTVTDTIKEIENGKIARTIDRSTLRRALTPQCFRYEILKRAFENADLSAAATDECFLVERLGCEIAIVEGSARNIKITHAEDLILAESLLKQTTL
ncbi:MAG TPA: 2-C-methyl-D-erythritol 4-phosphate cytidylyltransferase [Pyrinomonadaceae bacterium]|nr:2-C-methyl-D-erythritol 4-phosphate cytidylyltransferase [Pyrinomonadaceae bacterium]